MNKDRYPCGTERPQTAGSPEAGSNEAVNTPLDLNSLPSINPLQLSGKENVADLIDGVYAKSGFNARRLAEGAQLYARMIDEGATVAMTLAGAMTPIGMSGVIIDLMKAGFIDFVISTGANLYHDLHRAYDMPMVQGDFLADDNILAEERVARIYDVFIHDDDTLESTDEVILQAVRDIDSEKPFSSAELHAHIGRHVNKSASHPERSLMACAAELGIPIYTSSPGDSSIGMNLVIPHLFDRPVNLNPILDVIETAAIVRDADKNGVIEIGGGSPKNFYLQTQPTLNQILHDESKGGHDYFLQLTTDSPHWGGLSGATPSEARSWGKVKDAVLNNVVVYSCASLTLPLIAQYALIRCKTRSQRRLYDRLDEMVAELRSVADANETLRSTYKDHYNFDPLKK
ncbi:MAG: deoxyhypusine synthase [Phycisphaerae bacterium]|nr:MAG: deoxyhypusine synthase [Phycisphaerae bacterium]